MESGLTAEALLRNYRLGKTLGHGSFGKVKIAEHLRTGHKVAIKILNRRKMQSPDMEEKVRREIKICRLFVHPHVIRLYEVIETPADIYVVMEYVMRGELFDYIVEKGRLQEDEARRFFQQNCVCVWKQIIAGVEYCHRNMVVHRDLKPENLLLDSKGNVKLADFGLSNIMRDGHFLRTSCGSPNYAAPEVVSGKLYAGPEVDVWSCGVILYALLCGSLPFDDENIPNLFKKIKSGLYTLPSHLSPGARDLIPRMLIVDPMKRITTREIRQHPWFKVSLPRYLAVTPPNAIEHLKQLDEEIIQKVLRMGFDRNQLIESLQNRLQNDATVAYYLLFDNRSPVSTGYLGAEFQESMESCSAGPYPDVKILGSSLMPLITRKKQWLVGLQSPARPRDIMTQILGALQGLNVRWKKIGHYNMKCVFVHAIPDQGSLTAINHINGNHYVNSITSINANVSQPQCVVKFEMQLYKTSDVEYLLDLQRLSGPVFLFLDFCAFFMMRLDVL
ncbi:SNF1-related protein kinase catalytic subunit alpha KIN10 isoform X1 [Sesamum indicum]|uniref:non-specific serine/threonine protein kinase n=1 Tax=Sesamum indicum TaxID=4182 RepID=A0A6I9STX5_SESIN|nr:SNF1-related protein kinase catalytic subunit alpha KIN10 isoform X1 [Sesamum indicum]XP_011072806.1 SNF1-related protein kinase catalytic subunit alpha KIN10 isoform X1 [Sesamum indicum]XP_020548386.1 SNF1-related protein kinase catalytic subunit alpha KIN10 isoform X1 [Sesamum indicum]